MKGTGGGSYYVCVPGLFFFSQQSHTVFSRRICEITTDCYLPLTADSKENAVVRTQVKIQQNNL